MKVRTHFKFVIEDRDRHGNVRVYLRLPGKPKVRLRVDPGSPEFVAAYRAALAGDLPKPTRTVTRAAPGTLRALCETYYASASFLSLAPRTRRVKRLILDKLIEQHGHRLAAEMTPKGLTRNKCFI
jgi:hypothetical protein